MENFLHYQGSWPSPMGYPMTPNYVDTNSLMNSYCAVMSQLNAAKSKCQRIQKHNFQLQKKLKQKEEENRQLRARPIPQDLKKRKTIKKRRRNESQMNQHQCPYQNCQKAYASNLALNLHMKLKHNGGSKKERQAVAKMVIESQENGQQRPEVSIKFPPNYLQNYKKYLSIKSALQK